MNLTKLAVCAFVATGLYGCRASKPSTVEVKTVYWVKHHVTVGGKHDTNPFTATPENIDEGKEAFTQYCSVCHGNDGQNTGVPFANTIAPPVPSLTSAQVQAYSDGQLKWIIKNGLWPSGMPPAQGMFSDEDMWKMVLYIRHLPPKGSLGDPAAYGGESK